MQLRRGTVEERTTAHVEHYKFTHATLVGERWHGVYIGKDSLRSVFAAAYLTDLAEAGAVLARRRAQKDEIPDILQLGSNR
jgi:hypothetical protein